MKLNLRNFPTGNLPYEDIRLCKQMMLKLYEDVPFLPELPLLNDENIIMLTTENIPAIKISDENLLIIADESSEELQKALDIMNITYNSETYENYEQFSSNSAYITLYWEMLKRIKPKHTVINILGPYSLAESISNIAPEVILTDRNYRKFISECIALKTIWFLQNIKKYSPDTKPIIMLNEPHFSKFGMLKYNNENITAETLPTLYSKLVLKIKKLGAFVGVQSFDKCNWQIILDSNVDMISFGAYNNPQNLNIIAPKVNNFLSKGGYINWGMIPVNNEKVIKSLNIDSIYKKFTTAIEELSSEGVSLDLLYRNSTVSVQGNMSELPIIYAEKALILANQLSKKIPMSSRL